MENEKTEFYCTCFDGGVFDIRLDCRLHFAITIQDALNFAEFFWANVKGTCTNGYYTNQRDEKVTVKDMYFSYQQIIKK
jgi:hypothetical protein